MVGLRYDTVVEEEGPGVFIRVPAEVVSALSDRKRPPVRVTVNGFTFRSTVAVYGGEFFLPLNAANRSAAGVAPGDKVKVELEFDDLPRLVEPPEELAAELATDPEAAAAFEALSYTHRREYAEYVAEGRRPETRRSRARRALEQLRDPGGGTKGET